MFKKNVIAQAVFLGLVAAPAAQAVDWEVSGYLRNETSAFTKGGQKTGDASSMVDSTSGHDSGDLLKSEFTANLFVNGEFSEDSSFHAQIKAIYDTEGVHNGSVDYRGHKNSSQHDWLRELYVDSESGGWYWRVGKQQVVWGTADGVKLLDIINPTDYREMAQNSMDESRIPVWMINAERDVGESSSLQVIVAQAEENKIPGLNAGGDFGHAFLMKGVDSITGRVNGFLNVAPNLAKVANSFHNFATAGSFTGGVANAAGLSPFTNLSVDGFASQNWNVGFVGTLPTLAGAGTVVAANSGSTANPLAGGPGTYTGFRLLNTFANDTTAVGANSNSYLTNLMHVGGAGGVANTVYWSSAAPTSAFEYMSNATFATFNTFAGNQGTGGTIGQISTQYMRDYDDSEPKANLGFRFKDHTDEGLNYSLNYFYHYDSNPAVDLSWHDRVTGAQLTTELRNPGLGGMPTGAVVARNAVPNNFTAANSVTVLLRNGTSYYGAVNPTTGATGDATHATNGAVLRFTERLNRIHSFGGAFDYSLDTEALGAVVLRGEVLYNKDELQPVVDKRLLSIGDLEGALRMQEADMLKYVIGADVTVATNMMVSAQFIQFRNLDYIENGRSCTAQMGSVFDCSEYTADMATLHMSNGFKRAEENKEFYSLFLTKPFGPSQEHRWGNILMYEENGGYWDRVNVEYTFRDDLIGTAELNYYWGDENTQFGQFKKSSNVQVGIQYIF